MDPARRKTYLKALGVDLWVERATAEAAAAAAPAGAAPAVMVAAADPVARKSTVLRVEEPRVAAAVAARAAPAIKPVATPSASPVVTPVAANFEVPGDWSGLRAVVKDCTRCKLCNTRTQTVFGVGPESAPLMIVGEAPGADEDAQGEPFVGRAGKLLDEMLASIGRSRRDNVFIANVIKCRPPGNRDPEADEVEACRPYLEQQIALIRPKLIVGLGLVAARRLLATDAPLSRLRGPIHRYGAEQTPLFITYHPAYLLRSPREKAKSWEDLKKVWRFLRDA